MCSIATTSISIPTTPTTRVAFLFAACSTDPSTSAARAPTSDIDMRRTTHLLIATILVASCVRAEAQGNAPAKWADTLSAEIEQAQLAGDVARLDASVTMASRIAMAYPNDA